MQVGGVVLELPPEEEFDPVAQPEGVGHGSDEHRAVREHAVDVRDGDVGELEMLEHFACHHDVEAGVGERQPAGVADDDGRLTEWLGRHEAHAVIVRPDFYVFGSAGSPAELPALIEDLRARLALNTQPLMKEH